MHEHKSVDVMLDPRDARFKRLVADLDQTIGVYTITHHGHSVKIGLSKTGIGQRLMHHVSVDTLDSKTHPAWWLFMRAALGRTMTISWQECKLDTVRAVEKAALAAASPLWEREKHVNQLLRRERKRQPAFQARIASIFDEWEQS